MAEFYALLKKLLSLLFLVPNLLLLDKSISVARDICTQIPSLVILVEMSAIVVMSLSLLMGSIGLITNLGPTMWALLNKDARAFANLFNVSSLVNVIANSNMILLCG